MILSKVISLSDDVSYQAWKAPEFASGDTSNTAEALAFPYKQETAGEAPKEAGVSSYQDDLDDAYHKGLEEGLKQSGTSHEGQTEQLQQILQALTRPVQRVNDNVEAELVELSLAVAKLILQREISEDPKHIAGLIREAVKQLPAATQNVRIHLNPDDAVIVQSALATSEKSSSWMIEADPAMKPGDCQIHTDTSFIDAGIDGLINRLAAEMLGGHRSTDLNEKSDDASS